MSFDTCRASAVAAPELHPHFGHHRQPHQFTAAEIDRLADHELAVGHVNRAEMLSWRAAELREKLP